MDRRHVVSSSAAFTSAVSRRAAIHRLGASGTAAVAAALALGAVPAAAQVDPSSAAADTVLLFFERVVNDLAAVDAATVDEYIDSTFADLHNAFVYPHPDAGFPRLDGYRPLLDAIPNMRFDINATIAADDLVMAFTTLTGTHTGADLFNLSAGDYAVEVQGIDLFSVRGGKLAQHWGFADVFKMTDQLQGRVPAQSQAQT